MKTLALTVLLAGCSSYSERGTGEGGREIGENGYTVRCDASPPNQPGCYQPAPSFSWWPSEKLNLRLGPH
ncbi:hypothetical protein NJC40_08585 [Pseudomonas sp. 21LCFQ02]|uniref:hypothetical protein n=1 Tax=unclassified Pseudomonas TaxID=196821 RepID=UPI00209AA942|nr:MULTISPECIES: hypothetical protein [unclassified Pseudomonas]MCO8167833.1 hypothetical protein [Pseudomonas sp. 21LCFQ02]MCQ9426611.1 hypothetical protein [Pseudomonas sp. LJDD11]